MALAGVLSAMREIILNAPAVPDDREARLKTYKESFPFLSTEELEDLSKIPPAKFGIYTTSIFMSEKELIQNNFPMTVKVLEKHWASVSGGRFSLFQLVQELHKAKPWRSTASVVLGRNFIEFLRELPEPLHSRAPYLNELAEMELLIRKVRKQPDDPREAAHGLKVDEIRECTVDRLMSLSCCVPACAVLRKFEFDLLEARARFMQESETLPEEIAPAETFAVLSRDTDGHPRWTVLSRRLHEFLAALPKSKLFPIEELAEVLVSGEAQQAAGEEEMFLNFVQNLARLVTSGAVSVFEE